MAEIVRRFFGKKRNLIVISLLVAAILAALTPYLIPLVLNIEPLLPHKLPEFDPETISSVSFICSLHDETLEQMRAVYGGCSAIYRDEECREICRLLGTITQERTIRVGQALCTIRVKDQKAPREYILWQGADGHYLTCVGEQRWSWLVPEQTAEALLGHCRYARMSVPETAPRALLADPTQIAEISLYTCTDTAAALPIAFSAEEIARFCTFWEELDGQIRYQRLFYQELNFTSGWELELTLTCGTVLRLQHFAHPYRFLTLGAIFPGQTLPDNMAQYVIEGEADLLDLPALLGLE